MHSRSNTGEDEHVRLLSVLRRLAGIYGKLNGVQISAVLRTGIVTDDLLVSWAGVVGQPSQDRTEMMAATSLAWMETHCQMQPGENASFIGRTPGALEQLPDGRQTLLALCGLDASVAQVLLLTAARRAGLIDRKDVDFGFNMLVIIDALDVKLEQLLDASDAS